MVLVVMVVVRVHNNVGQSCLAGGGGRGGGVGGRMRGDAGVRREKEEVLGT